MHLFSLVSVLILYLALTPAALAASVAPHNGEVHIYQDSGFVSIVTPTQVAAGTTIMVPAGRSATVAFDAACGATVHGPATFQVPVRKGADCPAHLLDANAGGQPPAYATPADIAPGLHSLGKGPLIVGGLVVAGGVAAAIALANGDDDKTKPASP